MGIQNLFRFLTDENVKMKEYQSLDALEGQTVAIDISMNIYQCLIQIRYGEDYQNLTAPDGTPTSHISGIMYKMLQLMEHGIKPIAVFDGKPPDLKRKTLKSRRNKREESQKKFDQLKALFQEPPSDSNDGEKEGLGDTGESTEQVPVDELGGLLPLEPIESLESRVEDSKDSKDSTSLSNLTPEEVEREKLKMVKRGVHVTKTHNEDIKTLLRLMGVPIIESPGEAEATCVALVEQNFADRVATEDMDALTFGAKKLIRNLTSSSTKSKSGDTKKTGKAGKAVRTMVEIQLEDVLKKLQITMDQFIDFCILCGCDYTGHMEGIGKKNAFKLIQDHQNIETILEDRKQKIASLEKELERKEQFFQENQKPKTKAHLKKEEMLQNLKSNMPKEGEFLFVEARQLFKHPDVCSKEEMKKQLSQTVKFGPDRESQFIEFLVQKKGFDVDRVTKIVERIKKSHHKMKMSCSQSRIGSFFKLQPSKPKPVELKSLETKTESKIKTTSMKPVDPKNHNDSKSSTGNRSSKGITLNPKIKRPHSATVSTISKDSKPSATIKKKIQPFKKQKQ